MRFTRDGNRDKAVILRVTAVEHEHLFDAAERRGMKASELIRAALDEYLSKPPQKRKARKR